MDQNADQQWSVRKILSRDPVGWAGQDGNSDGKQRAFNAKSRLPGVDRGGVRFPVGELPELFRTGTGFRGADPRRRWSLGARRSGGGPSMAVDFRRLDPGSGDNLRRALRRLPRPVRPRAPAGALGGRHRRGGDGRSGNGIQGQFSGAASLLCHLLLGGPPDTRGALYGELSPLTYAAHKRPCEPAGGLRGGPPEGHAWSSVCLTSSADDSLGREGRNAV